MAVSPVILFPKSSGPSQANTLYRMRSGVELTRVVAVRSSVEVGSKQVDIG